MERGCNGICSHGKAQGGRQYEINGQIQNSLSAPRWSWSGRIRNGVLRIVVLAVMQVMLLPVAPHAEMAQPQISDSVGIGLLAGFALFLVAVGLMSRKTETAPAFQDQHGDSTITLPEDTALSPFPVGTVAIASW